MIIKILFGDDEEIIVNPNCSRGNFFDYLCTELGERNILLPNKECVDLVDIKGNLQKVNILNINNNVGDLLTDRETYIPVSIQTVDEVVMSYSPLLSPSNKLHERISSALSSALRRPSKRGTPDQPMERSKSNLSRAGATGASKKTGRIAGKK